MKVVAGFVKSCSNTMQDYYQEGYDDITNLLIKFLRKEGTTMKEIRVKAGFEEVYDKLQRHEYIVDGGNVFDYESGEFICSLRLIKPE